MADNQSVVVVELQELRGEMAQMRGEFSLMHGDLKEMVTIFGDGKSVVRFIRGSGDLIKWAAPLVILGATLWAYFFGGPHK